MGIRSLKIFKAVCDEGSVTAAAKRLYMTQPAVSQAIKELENEKGFPLFDRISRRLYITDAGRQLLEKTEQLLTIYDEIETINEGSFFESSLRLGSCITAACYWLPRILPLFHRQCPKTKLDVQVAAADGVISLLKANRIDMALLEGPYILERCVQMPFSTYNIIAVCSPAHPFADGRTVSLDELLSQPLLLREQGSAIRDPFDSFLLLRGRVAEPMVTSVNSQALIELAKSNAGIALLADKVAEQALLSGSVCRVNMPELSITNSTSIAYHEGKYIPQSISELIYIIRSQI